MVYATSDGSAGKRLRVGMAMRVGVRSASPGSSWSPKNSDHPRPAREGEEAVTASTKGTASLTSDSIPGRMGEARTSRDGRSARPAVWAARRGLASVAGCRDGPVKIDLCRALKQGACRKCFCHSCIGLQLVATAG